MTKIIKVLQIILLAILCVLFAQHIIYKWERQQVYKEMAERMTKSVEDYNP